MTRHASDNFGGREWLVAWASRPSFPHSRSPGTRDRGFTLVEVLATLVLLGIVVPVAMRGVSVGLAAASTARHTAEAASLAEAKLNELIIDGAWQTSGTSGEFPDHPAYRWTCDNVSRDYGTNEVAVTVTWMQRGQERRLTLTTLVYPNANGAATETDASSDADAAATGGGE